MTDPVVDPDFLRFKAAYPKWRNPADARKAWAQTAGIRPPIDELIAAVERGKRSVDWNKCDREGNKGAFVPYPASWLRGEMWDDVYEVKVNGAYGNGAAAHRDPPAQKLGGPPTPEQIAASKTVLMAVRSGR